MLGCSSIRSSRFRIVIAFRSRNSCLVIVVISDLNIFVKIFTLVLEELSAALGICFVLLLGKQVDLVEHLVSDLWSEREFEGPLEVLTQDLSIEFFVERLGVLSGAISCSVSSSCCLGFLPIFVFVKVGVDIFVLILLLCQVVELKDGSVSSVGAELDEIGA